MKSTVRRFLMICLIPGQLLLVICLMAGQALANTYYVATNGSETGSGPYLSISNAVRKCTYGDTVIVSNGTYIHAKASNQKVDK